MLQNLKIALDGGLPLGLDFFSDRSLFKFFGEGKIIRDSARSDWTSGEITRLVSPSDIDQPHSSAAMVDVNIHYWRKTTETRNLEAGIAIEFRSSTTERPSFAEVENIFGNKGTVLFDPRPDSHRQQRAATAPHGNDVVLYESAQKYSTSELRIYFSFDARVTRVSAWVAEVKP